MGVRKWGMCMSWVLKNVKRDIKLHTFAGNVQLHLLKFNVWLYYLLHKKAKTCKPFFYFVGFNGLENECLN